MMSLILGTVYRTDELELFLRSLDAQTCRDFELLVVDQNPDDRLGPLLKRFESRFPIVHLRSEKGLSRAKNVGLEAATGDLIGFPDDNCLFPQNLLERVVWFFDTHPEIHGLTGRSADESGVDSNGRFDSRPGIVDRFNVWRRGIAYNVFLRAEEARRVRFNNALGPGSGTPWGAGDETDYLLRLLDHNVSIHYDPSLVVVHPHPVPPYNARAMSTAYAYGCGTGRVIRTHKYPWWFKASCIAHPLAATLGYLVRRKLPQAKYRWNTFLGRLRGLTT